MTHEQLAKMTPEEKQIRIAEICGWKIDDDYEDGALMGHHQVPDSEFLGWDMVPDYLNDLNAMHDAEKVLGEKCKMYHSVLSFNGDAYLGEDNPDGWVFHVSASKRADAFLLTLG
jgi:hypothetical protein